MALVAAADRFQRRHRWAGLPLAVGYKYVDDQAGFLAGLITYYGFLSLFPALLLLVTILGYVLAGNPEAQQRILDSTLAQIPVIGTELEHSLASMQGNSTAAGLAVLGLLYGVLGIGQAAQLAMNQVWAVPRNERPNPIASRVKSMMLVLLIGAGLVVTTALTGVGAATGSLDSHASGVVRVLLLVASVLANVVVFGVAFRLLTARAVPVRDLWPGAVFAALGWQGLQAVATSYVSRVVANSSDVYGVFAIVLGLFAWIYLAATVTVLGAEVNVVRACRLWPRSLLAPFADGLPITAGDERAYTSYVEMRRHKSFEQIDVAFHDPTTTVGDR